VGARKKIVKEEKFKLNISNDIKGVILITISFLMMFSIYTHESLGLFGAAIKNALFYMIGIGSYLLPVIIFLLGLAYIVKKGRVACSKKFFGIILFYINSLLLAEMIIYDKHYGGSFLNGFKNIYHSGSIIHGGIVSYILDYPLYKLFGKTGCYIIFTGIYIIAILLFLNNSLYEIIKSKKDKRAKNKTIAGEKAEDQNLNKEEFIKNLNSKIKILDYMKKDESQEKGKQININDYYKPSEEKDANEEIVSTLEKEIKETSENKKLTYEFPQVDLLNKNTQVILNKEDKKELLTNAKILENTLESFGVSAKVIQVSKGPSVTRFELQPQTGVKVSKIVNLADDIALNLASGEVRIEAPIPGKAAVGIEVPNKDLMPVYLREVIESEEYINAKAKIAFAMGKDIGGNCVVSDLTKTPHLLIAGATGSGKSVCLNTLIIGILYKYLPEQVKLLMIDPKVVELSVFNGIPHLLVPVVTDPKKAAGALYWAVNEMTKRYKLFAENNVRNIEGYNDLLEKGVIKEKLPLIVIIIDELADLMMVCPNEVEDYIARLSQMARAAGMHLVIATQRPSVDVITGVIKANIPSRISFAVSSSIDSRTILDSSGAEKLLGKGDMLFMPVGESKATRIQGAFITEEEVEKVVGFIKKQDNNAEYKDELIEQMENSDDSQDSDDEDQDSLLEEAVRIIINADQASTSLLQRRLRVGYNRASRIIDEMEDKGFISGRDGSKPRQVLITENEFLNYFHNND
jgi:DNA segregation ATPase FtsK/SpoIIIE, S-DNA-T family